MERCLKEEDYGVLNFFTYQHQSHLLRRSPGGSATAADLMKRMQYRYPCLVCGRSYLRKAHLKRHMMNECIGVPPKYCCDVCPSKYKRNEDLKRHMMKVHNIFMHRPRVQNADMEGGGEQSQAMRYHENYNSATDAVQLPFLPGRGGRVMEQPESEHNKRRAEVEEELEEVFEADVDNEDGIFDERHQRFYLE